MARTATAGRTAGQGSKWLRKDKRLALYLRDDCCCAYCGRTVVPGVDATIDHVLACNLGGTNSADNLVTCCLNCNSAKRDLTMRRWYAYLRAQGTSTAGMASRVRAATARSLRSHRATAQALIEAAGSYTAACQALQATLLGA